MVWAALIFSVARVMSSPIETVLTKTLPNCSDWAQAANAVMKLGPEKGPQAVLDAQRSRQDLSDAGFMRDNVRCCYLFRLAFTSGRNVQLRPARLGVAVGLPTLSMNSDDWPMGPVVFHQYMIFVLSDVYSVAGAPESAAQYLGYLRKHGELGKSNYFIPTPENTKSALDSLLKSPAWTKLLWKDARGGTRYNLDAVPVIERLRQQADLESTE